MTKGIKAKDIRDFEKYVGKLNDVMKRIWAYQPSARLFATPDQLSLMAGWPEDNSGVAVDELIVAWKELTALETGDW